MKKAGKLDSFRGVYMTLTGRAKRCAERNGVKKGAEAVRKVSGMDRYVVIDSSQNPKSILRPRWKRTSVELNGRFESKYRHDMSTLLVQSYSEVGSFPHFYHIDGEPCPTHTNRIMSFGGLDHQGSSKRHGISSLEFDSKGIYLASVTKSGCLMVHDFETLYCQSNVISPWWLKEDEAKHLLHISPHQQLDAVEWNPANQDEVACTSLRSSEVFIFDVAYVSAEPVEVLRKRPSITIHSCDIPKGLSDVAFASSNDSSRVFASDTCGSINIWDRRMSDLPYLELTTNSRSALNSLQINIENQIVLGAGKQGIIYMWDLRGGRTTAAFQNPKEAYYPPMASVKLALLLEKIESLKAQSDIILKEIHSISLDPSCLHRLAFHLDDGWSGVLDIHSLELTHIHCPPPAWLSSSNMSANLSYLRKPSWISTNEIYVAGSSSDDGVYLLDFYADTSSPCHVDYREDVVNTSGARQNRFIPLSEGVTACAAHPLDGSIVAGTKQASLLMISQRHHSWRGDDCQ